LITNEPPQEDFTPADIVRITTQYLLGQEWKLVDPVELAGIIWQTLQKSETSLSKKHIELWIVRCYAERLYAAAYNEQSDHYQQAWIEISNWLHRRAYLVEYQPDHQDDIAQETLIDIQARWQKGQGLNKPSSLFSFLLTVMRNRSIDLQKKRKAKKRGEDKKISLETMAQTNDDSDTQNWEERIMNEAENPTSETVEMNQLRDQLNQFFESVLPTYLQQTVAKAHYLDDLSPTEIATLLGKESAQVRNIKARVVKILRTLPPDKLNKLMEILSQLEGKKP
jgi:RNA polymerase sigma factor (sigma-70 family)